MKNFVNTSHTVATKDSAMVFPVFKKGKPPLDSEMNMMSDLSQESDAYNLRAQMPSGWLGAKLSKGDDNAGNQFTLNFTNTPNTFVLNSLTGRPFEVNVNGWVISLGGNQSANDAVVNVVLDDAPALGSRQDLVFLEVWQRQIAGNPTVDGKPSATEIFKFGNVEYGGTNLPEDILHPKLTFETTERVQLQYRVRVVNDIDFNSFPEGLGAANVYGQAGATSPVNTFPYTKVGPTDAGLYISGDGDAETSPLKTIDGYVYAIPMFRINRRNTSSYSLSNLNGAGVALTGTSDRPDGLFYDQVSLRDVEDLRHVVGDVGDYGKLVNDNMNELFSGVMSNKLVPVRDGSSYQTHRSLTTDDVSSVDIVGSQTVATPNGQRRLFSDKGDLTRVSEQFTIFDKTFGTNGSLWINGDQVTVSVKGGSPTNTVIDFASITQGFVVGGLGDIHFFDLVSGGTPGVFTVQSLTAPATASVNPLFTDYDITYDDGNNGLSHQPERILDGELREGITSQKFDFLSDNNTEGEVFLPNAGTPTSGFFDKAVAHNPDLSEPNRSFTSLVDKFIQGNGSSTYDIAIDEYYAPHELKYIFSIQNLSSGTFLDPISVTKVESPVASGNFFLRFTLSAGVADLMKIQLGLDKHLLIYQEFTKGIQDFYQLKEFSITVNAPTEVSFAVDDIIYAVQSRLTSASVITPSIDSPVYQHTCYIDDSQVNCDVSFVDGWMTLDNFSTAPAGIVTVKVFALTTRTLRSPDDTLLLTYDHFPYQGIASQPNFGLSFADDEIKTLVYKSLGSVLLTTDGTGEVGNTLTQQYRTLSLKLPKAPSIEDSDLKNESLGSEYSNYEMVLNLPVISGGEFFSYLEGLENFLRKNSSDFAIDRGANRGSQFHTIAKLVTTTTSKMVVSLGLEKVISDTSGNFEIGELVLRVDTAIIGGSDVVDIGNDQITGLDDLQASDLFRIKGRPLVK